MFCSVNARRSVLRPACFAFTLIEVLVVISIVSVMASMMVPALTSAKEKARITQCMNNLRQLGMAWKMYASERDDTFPNWTVTGTPHGGHIRIVQGNYLASNLLIRLTVCPSDRYRTIAANYSSWDEDNNGYDVAYLDSNNQQGLPEKRCVPYQPLLTDRHVVNKTPMNGVMGAAWTAPDTPWDPLIAGPHLYGGNVFFVDGHVEFLTRFSGSQGALGQLHPPEGVYY